jgi:CheY-like chemotaxis protein
MGAILSNAENGQEAVDAVLNDNELDVILMDIQLPVMDGYKSTEMIRKIRPRIVIIAQTAYGFAGDKEKFLRTGFNDFIIKPVLSSVLFEKIRACLSAE